MLPIVRFEALNGGIFIFTLFLGDKTFHANSAPPRFLAHLWSSTASVGRPLQQYRIKLPQWPKIFYCVSSIAANHDKRL
jgi:hypothetical protein